MSSEFASSKRRLVDHERKNCDCDKCVRQLLKLLPGPTREERIASYQFEEREVKRAKEEAQLLVDDGKQATILQFFRR